MAELDPAHVEPGGPAHHYPGGPLVVTKLSVGPYDNNAYLLADPETREALLVDAANDEERLLGLLNGVELVGIVTTHRHPDHVQALPAVLRAHDVWNGAHPADAEERLLGLLNGVELVGIVTTHRHPDHVQALPAVLRAHDVWNGAHPADAE